MHLLGDPFIVISVALCDLQPPTINFLNTFTAKTTMPFKNKFEEKRDILTCYQKLAWFHKKLRTPML